MTKIDEILIVLGILLLAGMLAEAMAKRIAIPRVTLLLICGFLLGPSVFDFLSISITNQWFPIITKVSLGMVGFLIGGSLITNQLKKLGYKIIIISLSIVIATVILMSTSLFFLTQSLNLSLLLATIAIATAPAATTDVIHELKSTSRLSFLLKGIIAIDDFWALIVFSIVLAIVSADASGSIKHVLTYVSRDLFGAILLGILLEIPIAFLTGRIQEGEPSLAEALGAVFLCTGLALWLDFSFLIATMVMGIVVSNFAKHHTRPFHAVEGIEWPFMILFFLLAGASLHISALRSIGVIGVAYISLRIVARLIGSWFAGLIVKIPFREMTKLGLALLPQAGVSLGVALVAIQESPDLEDSIMPIVLSGTVFFELIGPLFTRHALLAEPI